MYYERRTNQFSNSNISRNSIVEIKEQLKSFMAMFFDLSHIVAGNIGRVVSSYREKFFQKDHSPIPYYISGLLSKKWDNLLLNDDKYKEFNKFRYHIFMGLRYLIEDLPFHESYLRCPINYSIKFEQKRKNSYDKLLSVLRDERKFKSTIDRAIEIFKKLDYTRPKAAYSNPITQEYKRFLQDYINLDTKKDITY